MAKRGSLVVVGTGIRTVGQITPEAIAWVKWADKVLYVVSDKVAENAIFKLNPGGAETLSHLYDTGKPRFVTYRQMVDRIVSCVREGHRTCVAYYGHPGIFAYPAHAAIRTLRKEGYEARMLPGISAEDCLFADLGVDPAAHGCQSYEATHFVVYRRRPDPTAALILWQLQTFGQYRYSRNGYAVNRVPVLVEYLSQFYSLDREVCIYESPIYFGCAPRIEWLPLGRLGDAALSSASTLYVPPAELPPPDAEMMARLELPTMDEAKAMLAAVDKPKAASC